jgi:hypothetical protein
VIEDFVIAQAGERESIAGAKKIMNGGCEMIRATLALSLVGLMLGACGMTSSLGSGGESLNGTGGTAGAGGNGAAGAGATGGSSGSGGQCVSIDPSKYDQSCQQASDCVYIASGHVCSGQCGCGDALINSSSLAQYKQDTSSIDWGMCACPDERVPDCINHKCTIPGPVDAGPPPACTSDSDCAAPDLCRQCSDGSSSCAYATCENGQCVTGFNPCPNENCTSDSDCPTPDLCQQCSDGSQVCAWSKCESGQCVTGIDSCNTYDPCAGKSCGDTCNLCPPNDPNCIENGLVKYCDASGQCTAVAPTCANP